MAQPTEWAPAILDYMKKVRSNISTCDFSSGGSRNLERGFPVVRAEATPTNYNRAILLLHGSAYPSVCVRVLG